MRLIDCEALRKAMYHEAFETDSDMQRWDSGCWIRYKMFENALESAPTIDAVPVVWTPISERQPDVYGQYLVTAVWQGELVTDFDDYFVYGWDDYGDTVVAWMPAPKPYDGEREDDE